MDDFSFTIEVITRGFVLKSCFLSFNKSICGAFELCEKHSRDTGNPSQGLQIKSISVSISRSLRPSPSPHRFVLPYLDSSLQKSAISAGAADKTTELRMAMAMSVNWKGGSTVTSFAPPRNRGCHVNSNETSRRITSSLMVSFGYNANCSAASIDKACNFGPRQQLYPWSEPNLIPRYRRRPTNNVFLPHLVASMEVEVTYIMVKPDGVQRGLVGEIISRFEKKGFLMKGLKLFQCSKELAEEHYKELKSKPFFPKLIDYITSGPVVCMAWEGVGVVASARKLIGATNPLQAEPGTIRGDLAIQTGRNIVHGSDSPENGLREIALWFKEGELCGWTQVQASWLME